ncbi:transcriptional regulator [Candidatus Pacearchaeota archaeon CG10_big_fil_rev_8_21_14_0_10_32_14]|nr:MAG: transcriptional regulator [Candidatus Pacearchaeota archaeon CG10_big_fil_rev_8_21_14_0_10_32_14]
MKQVMPQEIEVWYLIPALRKELAKIFLKDYGMSQKEIANLLGLTESAVSQYIRNKRGNELKFNSSDLKIINLYAKKINDDRKNSLKNIYELCYSLKKNKVLCALHKIHNNKLPKECNLCSMKN